MPHTGLGGQMDDAVDVAMPVGQRQHGLAVGNVGLEEGEALVLAQRLQPGELQDRVVVVAEIVDADDRLATRQQGAGDVAADETRGAGDEDGHNGLRTGNALQNEWKERRRTLTTFHSRTKP